MGILQHAKHITPLILENRLTELTYFVTDLCNMKCRHCFVTDALNKKLEHLNSDEFLKIISKIPTMQRVQIGGGEPFTRKDLAFLITNIENSWKTGVICIPTNGWFTDRVVKLIEYYGPRTTGNLRLHLSINSFNPDDMDSFTQLKGSFKRWRETVKQALIAKEKYPHITLVALITFNEYNQDEFINLIDYLAQEVGIDDISFQLVRAHGSYRPKLDIAKYRAATAYYFSKYNTQHPVLAAYRESWRNQAADYYQDPKYRKRCTSGKLRLVMAPNGDLYPCETLGYPNLKTMGNWYIGNIKEFDYDLQLAANSTQAKELHKKITCTKCHCDHTIDQNLSSLASTNFQKLVIRNAANKLFP